MSIITTWGLSLAGIGPVGIYSWEFGYAGGFAISGLGDAASLEITNLGGSDIALGTALQDPNGNMVALYLNSHYAMASGGDNGGMMLWFAGDNGTYSSGSIGPEQTFRLVNLGGGNIALQASSGAFPGQYLGGQQGGGYPTQWGYGTGSFISSLSPVALQVDGPLLPILIITNSGFQLDLSEQSLAGISLTNADMRGCNLSQADLSKIGGLHGADFTGATLCGVNLAGQTLSGANWTGANFTGTDLSAIGASAGANLAHAILTNAILRGVNLSKAALPGASLAGAILDGADLTGADLSGANLSGLDLRQVKLKGADLGHANLSGCNLAGVDLTGASLQCTDFRGCNPAGMRLGDNSLQGTDFSNLDLTAVQFPTSLGQSSDPAALTNFTGAKLPYSAVGLNWSCLNLTGTDIVGMPADLAGLQAANVHRPNGSFEGCNLTGASFSQATLDGAVFTNAMLSNAVFGGASMIGAVFDKAKLDGASFIGTALGGVSGDKAAVFSFAYIANCNFAQANLFGVSFTGATFASGNELSGSANLQETDFTNTFLMAADFNGAVLQGAKFDNAFMVGCDLTNVDLSPTRTGAVPASLTATCLQGVTFQDANLSGADLTNAAITDTAGRISMQYYDEDGTLTKPFMLPYAAGSFPATTAFSGTTVCPNGVPYATNQSNGLSLAQMMVATTPPTKWTPPDQAMVEPSVSSRQMAEADH